MVAYSVVMFEGEIGDGEAIEGLVPAQLHICHGLWVQGGDLLMGELPATVVACVVGSSKQAEQKQWLK